MKRFYQLFFILFISLFISGCAELDSFLTDSTTAVEEDVLYEDIAEDGYFTTKDEVARYILTYKKLPDNYITKAEAMELGWIASEGNLWEVTDRKSIGGDRFYNREGILPKKEGRIYFEADINYEGGYRGPERIVYSNDDLIYYTDDHYDTFTLLYGDE